MLRNSFTLVGFAPMDEEHSALLEVFCEVERAVSSGPRAEDLRTRLSSAVTCLATHFEHEESAMKRYGYPAFEEHSREHGEALGWFFYVLDGLELSAADPRIAGEHVLSVLETWLYSHLRDHDAALAPFLRNRCPDGSGYPREFTKCPV